MILEAEAILCGRAEASVRSGKCQKLGAMEIRKGLSLRERIYGGLKLRGGFGGFFLSPARQLGYNELSVMEDLLHTGAVRRLNERKGSLGVWPRRREALNSFHYVLVMPKASRTALCRANYREDRVT